VYHFGRVDDLTTLQNQCLYHIQPSESEGFGHVLFESLATGSVTITTDAPPMNELENVIKVAAKRNRSYNYAWLYTCTVEDLESKVEEVINMPSDAIKTLSNLARQEYLNNDQRFRNTFKELIQNEIT
jgi:glycosyltransferase involved in cell wall biosynthesis